MKLLFLGIILLMQQCSGSSNPPAPDTGAGGDFRSHISKGKDVLVENQTVEAPLDFLELLETSTIVPGTQRATAQGSITFVKCRFKGKVTAFNMDPKTGTSAVAFAKNLTFLECTFDEEVNFRNAVVNDIACFSNCNFIQKANFESADFQNDALFGGCKFQSDLRFQNAYFRRKADFLHTEFGKSANFQSCVFGLDAQFGAVRAFGNTDFSMVQFQSHAFFNYAEWNGPTTFTEVWFKGRCEFLKNKFVKTAITHTWFLGIPRFEESTIDIELDLEANHWAGGKPDLGTLDAAKYKHFE